MSQRQFVRRPVGLRKPEGRGRFRVYWEQAIDLNGPEVEAIVCSDGGDGESSPSSAASSASMARFIARCSSSMARTDPSASIASAPMPTAGERLIWGFGDGSTMPVFKTSLGAIGAVICWENYMPMLRTYTYKVRASASIARPLRMIAIPGCPPCSTSH